MGAMALPLVQKGGVILSFGPTLLHVTIGDLALTFKCNKYRVSIPMVPSACI